MAKVLRSRVVVGSLSSSGPCALALSVPCLHIRTVLSHSMICVVFGEAEWTVRCARCVIGCACVHVQWRLCLGGAQRVSSVAISA